MHYENISAITNSHKDQCKNNDNTKGTAYEWSLLVNLR